MKQLIYRRDSNAKFTDVNAAGFVYCQCNNDISSISTILAANFGRLGLWKKRVKLWIGRRAFFGIISENQLVHYGWVSFGFCKHYKIEKTNAVIGPVWTSENNRGKGLATIALKLSINRILECGWRGIYIDTTEDNLAMQRVIHRCDFNTLVGTYVRSNDKTPGQSLISTLKKCFPQWLIRFGRHFIDMASRDRARWQREYNAVLAQAKPVPVNNALPRLGIIKDTMQRHSYYEAACLELGVPYELLDITGPDWVDVVRQSDCAAYLVRPFVLTSIGKRLYDERVRMMNEDLGKHVFPSVKSLWLYESKRRTAGWLAAHKIPQPTTWVFNDQPAALTFATGCEFPIVFKTDLGSEALGVEIVRDRTALCRLIKLCFGRGVAAEGYDAPRNAWGEILLQEFIPNAKEWRMVRIGDSYFGHRKGKVGDFHSGSKIIEFDDPPEKLLRFVKEVTDQGPFENMALDVLEGEDGAYRIIELHCYFGCNSPHVMIVNGEPGRYRYDGAADRWVFEIGEFNRNASCNLRVEHVLSKLGFEVSARHTARSIGYRTENSKR